MSRPPAAVFGEAGRPGTGRRAGWPAPWPRRPTTRSPGGSLRCPGRGAAPPASAGRARHDARLAVHRPAGLGPVGGRARLRGRAAVRRPGLRPVPVLPPGRRGHPRRPAAGPAGRALLRGAADQGPGAAGRGARRSTDGGGWSCSRTRTGPPSRRRTRCSRPSRNPRRAPSGCSARRPRTTCPPRSGPGAGWSPCARRPRPRWPRCWSAEGVGPDAALAAARAAQGHIGRARRLATDPQAAQRRAEVLQVPMPGSGRPGPRARCRGRPGQGGGGGSRGGHRRARRARTRGHAPGVRRRLDRQGGGDRRPRRGGCAEGTRGPAEVPGDQAEAGRARPGPARPGQLLPRRARGPVRRATWNSPTRRSADELDQVAAGSAPEATVRRIEAIMKCRERLAASVAPLLAVEEMTLALAAR